MASGIYRITSRTSGRSYVGSAVNITHRWKTHRNRLICGTHHSIALQRAYDKYGKEDFEYVVIEITAKEDLLSREQFWIEELHAYNGGYNATPNAGSLLGHRWTDEQKNKLKIRKHRSPCSPEEKAAQSARKKGVPRSAEVRARISESVKKKWAKDPEYRSKNSGHMTEERKRNISAAKLAQNLKTPEEVKRRMAATMRSVRAERFWSSRPQS